MSRYSGMSVGKKRAMGIGVLLFFALPSLHEVVIFTIAAGLIALCYGGGFGVMPAFTADFFGSKYVGGIYGWILVGWGIAAIPKFRNGAFCLIAAISEA